MTDDRRKRLETLRDQLRDAIATSSENMLPQLAGSYMKALEAIAALKPEVVVATPTDEILARREAKKKTATAAPRKRRAR